MSENKYTVIDLFCGCGGLSLGFEKAGFSSILAVDNWQDALVTYKYNRKNAHVMCEDIANINPQAIKDTYNISNIDVIIGGPPCQGFSIAGKRIIDDKRNSLYKSFVNFVNIIKPKAFVMENVPNILSIGGGVIKDFILNDFQSIGYTVSYKILLASDYGVPQNRRRAVFVGILNGPEFIFPKKSTKEPITSEQALSDLPEGTIEEGMPYPFEPLTDYQKNIRENSKGLYNHNITIHTEQTKRIIAMVPDGGNYKDLPKEFWNTRKVHIAWTRLNSQKPSFTIDCGHNHHFHYKYNRVPTVRESARLQSFPDDFIFIGGKVSQLRQVGNAVPPLMAKQIALSLTKYL